MFGRKVISLNFAKQLTISTNKKIKPGYKLCPRCQSQQSKDIKSTEQGEIDSSATSSVSEITESENMNNIKRISFAENAKEKTNRSLAAIRESPINLHSISKEHRLSHCSKKIKAASKSLAKSLADAASIDINGIVTDNDDFTSNLFSLQRDQQDFAKLMEELKVKFNNTETSRAEKVQVLTLKPDSWTTTEIMSFFKCSKYLKYLANRATQAKKERGILTIPARKQRQGITKQAKLKVVSLYEDNEYSRILPGAKDKVSIGRGHYHQKRLLLWTAKELYAAFKLKYPWTKVGLLQFFEFKPKWCVAPGASGTHRVCVCSIHQNGVLLADACNMSYREMISVMVCDINNKICMVHRCSDCPGEEALLELLRKLFEEINSDFI